MLLTRLFVYFYFTAHSGTDDTMNRSILLAFAVYCLCCSATNADDYLLRVETLGYVDKSEKDPKEMILRSIEVVARPDSAFLSKVNTGTQTLLVAGKLRPADSGGFNVQIRYVYSIDTGITVPTEDGGRKSVLCKSATQTIITIAVGDSVTIGGLETTASESGEPKLKSKARCVLVLTKYEPTDD